MDRKEACAFKLKRVREMRSLVCYMETPGAPAQLHSSIGGAPAEPSAGLRALREDGCGVSAALNQLQNLTL